MYPRSARCSAVEIPEEHAAAEPILLRPNGGWCWYQDERAIVAGGKLIFGSVAGTTRAGAKRGDVARHLLGYDQSSRLERDYERDGGGGWDGLAEQWFESASELEAMRAEPDYAAIGEDLARFADPDATQFIVSAPPDVIIG